MAKKRSSKKKASGKKSKSTSQKKANLEAKDQVVGDVRIVKLDIGGDTLETMREAPTTKPPAIEMPIRPTEEYSEAEKKPKRGSGLESMPSAEDDEGIDRPSQPPRLFSAASADTRRVADRSQFPFSAVGRVDVTYRAPNGSEISGAGSGWVVGERTIYTAAHVVEPTTVFNGRTYRISRITFRPQHPSSVRAWNGTHLYVHNQYFSEPRGNLVYDLAAFVVNPNDDAIAPVTGFISPMLLTQFPVTGTGIGYPANPPTAFGFDGETMWQSTGAINRDTFQNYNNRRNDMTRGCSGGPWVVNLGGNSGIRAVGLNSHVRNAQTFNPMISPVFDDDYKVVIRQVKDFERSLNQGRTSGDPGYIEIF